MALSELSLVAEKRRFFLPESKLQKDMIDVEQNLGHNREHGVIDACLDPEEDFDEKFDNHKFPKNCALGAINLEASDISMSVDKDSIVCLACLPGYTPVYFEDGISIETCVEMTLCKKATLWVNGCDEP